MLIPAILVKWRNATYVEVISYSSIVIYRFIHRKWVRDPIT